MISNIYLLLRSALAGATAAGIQNIVGTGEPSYPKSSPYHECTSLFCCFSLSVKWERPADIGGRLVFKLSTGNWSFRDFVKDVTGGAFIGGVASVGFYGAGKAFGQFFDGVGNSIKQAATNTANRIKNFFFGAKDDLSHAINNALKELEQSELRPGQTVISKNRISQIVDVYDPIKASSSVYTDISGRYLVEGHHTTVATLME